MEPWGLKEIDTVEWVVKRFSEQKKADWCLLCLDFMEHISDSVKFLLVGNRASDI